MAAIDYKKIILLSIGNIVLVVAIVVFNLNVVVAARENRFDFYPRWVGSQAFWNGQSPYDDAVTDRIQIGMFGSLLPETSDQQRYAYPAYTSLVIAPLLLFNEQTAIAIWMAVQLCAVLITVVLWTIILAWRPSLGLFFALVIGLVFAFRYPMILYIIGQFTGTILLLTSLGILLLLRGQDTLAGVVFAFSTVPPTVSAPLALIILGGYVLTGRWRGLAAFVITMAALVGISVVFVGWWIPDFLHQLGDYGRYAHPVWAPGIAGAPLGALFVVGVTIVWLLWTLREFVRHHDSGHQIQFALVAMIAALILVPQTGSYYLVLLIPPILVAAQRAQACAGKWRRILNAAVLLAIMSPWLYFVLEDALPDAAALLMPAYVALLTFVSFRTQRHANPLEPQLAAP